MKKNAIEFENVGVKELMWLNKIAQFLRVQRCMVNEEFKEVYASCKSGEMPAVS